MKRQKLKFEKIEALAHEIKKLCEFEEALRNSYGVRSTIKFDNHTEAFELQEYAKYYIHQIVADKLKERREEFGKIKGEHKIKRKKLSKSERIEIHNKTDGHCAYCGFPLKITDMHIS